MLLVSEQHWIRATIRNHFSFLSKRYSVLFSHSNFFFYLKGDVPAVADGCNALKLNITPDDIQAIFLTYPSGMWMLLLWSVCSLSSSTSEGQACTACPRSGVMLSNDHSYCFYWSSSSRWLNQIFGYSSSSHKSFTVTGKTSLKPVHYLMTVYERTLQASDLHTLNTALFPGSCYVQLLPVDQVLVLKAFYHQKKFLLRWDHYATRGRAHSWLPSLPLLQGYSEEQVYAPEANSSILERCNVHSALVLHNIHSGGWVHLQVIVHMHI